MEQILAEELRKKGEKVFSLLGKQLSKVPDAVLDLTDVEVLDLAYNNLTELPTSIGRLIKLKEIDLSHNKLTKLPGSIGGLVDLITLRANHNKLSVLPSSFRGLKKFQRLALSNNKLKTFPEDVFYLENLTSLWLSNNQISVIPANIEQLEKLQFLYVSNNNLKTVPKEIAELKLLRALNLDGNPLTFDHEGIKRLKRLKMDSRLSIAIRFPDWRYWRAEEPYIKEDREIIFEGKVTPEEVSWNFKEASACITFPSMAVAIPTQITCSLLSPSISSPPLTEDMALVSNIIELSCDASTGSKGFEEKVTVALSHSAINLRGYELVIQALVDKDRNEWKDLETRSLRKASGLCDKSRTKDVPDWLFPFAEAEATRCYSFAVIQRLKSFTFYKASSETTEFTCTVVEFPSVSVTIPQSPVPASEEFSLTIKVQEILSCDQKEGTPGPVIHISCSEEVKLLEPATITIPLTLREDSEELLDEKSSQVRVFFLDTKDASSGWADITGELASVDLKNGVVTFQVSHFSRYWLWRFRRSCTRGSLDTVRRAYRQRQPLRAGFLACLCDAFPSTDYGLILCCFPRHLRKRVKQRVFSTRVVCSFGEEHPKKVKCNHGDAFSFTLVSLDAYYPLTAEDKTVRFLANSYYEPTTVLVKYVGTDVPQVLFFKQHPNGKRGLQVCTVSLLGYPQDSVPGSQAVLFREQSRKIHSPHSTSFTLQKLSEQQRGSHNSSDRTLNLLMLGDEWGSSRSDVWTVNRELAINFANQDQVRVTYFVPEDSCTEEEIRDAHSRYGISIVKAQKRPGFDPLEWLSYPTRDLSISFVVGHGAKFGKQAYQIKFSHSCKWMQVLHTDPEELSMYRKDSVAISNGEKEIENEVAFCKEADLVVAVGPKLWDVYSRQLRQLQREKDVTKLTPAILKDLRDVEPVAEDAPDSFNVLLFGHSDAKDFSLKGYDIAAKAFVHLGNSYVLLFVGAADGGEVAEFLCQHDIPRSQLRIRGPKTRREWKSVFREADLAIMPSRTEGFGMAGLEALSAGLPILVSGNSGLARALREVEFGTSCIVESHDPKVWAEKITNVLQKNRKQRLKEIEALRKSYDEEYNTERQCKTLVEKMWSMAFEAPSEYEAYYRSVSKDFKDVEIVQMITEAELSQKAPLEYVRKAYLRIQSTDFEDVETGKMPNEAELSQDKH